jgi:hypothetical protein
MASLVKNLVMVINGYNSSTQSFSNHDYNKDKTSRPARGFDTSTLPPAKHTALTALTSSKKGRGKEIDPNQVIPMGDDDFKDF